MLADSNLLIYAAKPEYAGLEAWMAGLTVVNPLTDA